MKNQLLFAMMIFLGVDQVFAATQAVDPRCEMQIEVAAKTAKELAAYRAVQAAQGDAPKKGVRLIPRAASESAMTSYQNVYVRLGCGTAEQFYSKIEAKNRAKPMTARERARLCEEIVSSVVLDNMVGRVSGEDTKESRANSKRAYDSSLYDFQIARCGNEQNFQTKIKSSLARMLASMNLQPAQTSGADRNSYSRVNYVVPEQTFPTRSGTR